MEPKPLIHIKSSKQISGHNAVGAIEKFLRTQKHRASESSEPPSSTGTRDRTSVVPEDVIGKLGIVETHLRESAGAQLAVSPKDSKSNKKSTHENETNSEVKEKKRKSMSNNDIVDSGETMDSAAKKKKKSKSG
jgi:hypothetical protein